MTGRPAAGPGGPGGGPIRFGGEMTGVEALMWRLGRHDPRFRATMSLVVTLEGPVPLAELESRLAALCQSVPRLRERVRDSALAMVPPGWEPDPSFSLDHHLAVAAGPVWDVASSVVETAFEEDRPPWRVVVPSPLPAASAPAPPAASAPAPAAVVLHLHHSYTDGLGGMRLLAELFDLEAGPQGPGAAPGPRAGSDPGLRSGPGPGAAGMGEPSLGPTPPFPGSLSEVLRNLEGEMRRAAHLWSRALPWASRTLAAAHNDPAGLLRSAAELAAALQAHAGAAFGPASPILSGRSAGVVLAPLRLDLGEMRRVAARAGATVNDVFLAGLLDGLARYHSKHGSVSPSLRLGMPISSRESGVDLRNQVFGAVMRGPLGSLDFDERVRLVHEIVLQARNQPWASFVEDAAEGAVRLPGAVRAVAAVLSSLDVLASNVTGPPVPMWLAGVPVSSMTPVGPRSGAALNATLLSYRGDVSIGLNVDPAAVGDPEVLFDCLGSAFEEALGS